MFFLAAYSVRSKKVHDDDTFYSQPLFQAVSTVHTAEKTTIFFLVLHSLLDLKRTNFGSLTEFLLC